MKARVAGDASPRYLTLVPLVLLLAACVGCGGSLTVEVPLPSVDVEVEARKLAGRFDSRLALPFVQDEAWTVCRGYNVASHSGRQRYALDLSAARGSAGPSGCTPATASGSDGRRVLAPVSGVVAWFDTYDATNDLVCINRLAEAGGGSVLVGHILPKSGLQVGVEVTRGRTVLGSVVPLSKSSRSGYAHIHVAAFDKKGCQSPVPFTGSFLFECVDPLASDGRPNQHQGVEFGPC